SPAERSALVGRQELSFSNQNAQPGRQLPDEWRQPLLSLWGDMSFAMDGNRSVGGSAADLLARGLTPTRLADFPDQKLQVSLKLSRSEHGQLSLETGTQVAVKHGVSEP